MQNSLITAAAIAAISGAANASVIDFETTPAGVAPTDNAALDRSAPYAAAGTSVTFGFDTNSDLVADIDALFEAAGSADSNPGFVSELGTDSDDSARAGSAQSLDDWFLRQPSSLGNVPGDFIIDYSTPVLALSGEIWDIDGNGTDRIEQWEVTAFDTAGNAVASITSPLGVDASTTGTLESAAWVFSLASNNPISTVRIRNVGNAQTIGLAFDNYNATAIPTPGALGLASIAGLAALRRRR